MILLKVRLLTEKSPSHVGELGNFLGKQNLLNRTYEPVFSHIVFGSLEKNILVATSMSFW